MLLHPERAGAFGAWQVIASSHTRGYCCRCVEAQVTRVHPAHTHALRGASHLATDAALAPALAPGALATLAARAQQRHAGGPARATN